MILLALLLLAQGIPPLPGQTGIVTGVLRTERQLPATGVRIAAMAAPSLVEADAGGAVLASITETDQAGGYRLENIPPGRYFIIAGRIDVPTFHPGTLEMSQGTVIQVTPGAVLTGIDFTFREVSDRSTADVPVRRSFRIPVQVTVEGGAKPGAFTLAGPHLVLTRIADGKRTLVPLLNPTVALAVTSAPTDYRVTVENLATGYTVKSLRFSTQDLMKDAAQFPPAAAAASGATGTSVPIRVTLGVNSRFR